MPDRPPRVALYARVSTDDKGQDPEVQLAPMRELAVARGWAPEAYIDHAPASDLRGRREWRRLLADARLGRLDLVLVWKLDRFARSSLDAFQWLQQLDCAGVGFRILTQDIGHHHVGRPAGVHGLGGGGRDGAGADPGARPSGHGPGSGSREATGAAGPDSAGHRPPAVGPGGRGPEGRAPDPRRGGPEAQGETHQPGRGASAGPQRGRARRHPGRDQAGTLRGRSPRKSFGTGGVGRQRG